MELTKEESYAIQGIVYEYSSMYGGKIALEVKLKMLMNNLEK